MLHGCGQASVYRAVDASTRSRLVDTINAAYKELDLPPNYTARPSLETPDPLRFASTEPYPCRPAAPPMDTHDTHKCEPDLESLATGGGTFLGFAGPRDSSGRIHCATTMPSPAALQAGPVVPAPGIERANKRVKQFG